MSDTPVWPPPPGAGGTPRYYPGSQPDGGRLDQNGWRWPKSFILSAAPFCPGCHRSAKPSKKSPKLREKLSKSRHSSPLAAQGEKEPASKPIAVAKRGLRQLSPMRKLGRKPAHIARIKKYAARFQTDRFVSQNLRLISLSVFSQVFTFRRLAMWFFLRRIAHSAGELAKRAQLLGVSFDLMR